MPDQSEQSEVGIDGERWVRGVAQRAANALAESWIEAARLDAVIVALVDDRNTAARTAEQAQADAAQKPAPS